MTKRETIQRLAAIAARQKWPRQDRGRDEEDDHAEADEILLAYIDDADIRAAFERINKWYA